MAVYLTAEADNDLDTVPDGGCFVVGALVDHKAKPGVSLTRAEAVANLLAARSDFAHRHQCHGAIGSRTPRTCAVRPLRVARLPLAQYIDMRSRQSGGGLDVSTFAVVEMLLLWRQTRNWGATVSECQALRCAPLKKHVRWLPPYTHLNDESAARPATLVHSRAGQAKVAAPGSDGSRARHRHPVGATAGNFSDR